MITTHKLDFEVSDWHLSNDMLRFRVGTCEGLWSSSPTHYSIISIVNSNPGNGHLTDVFEWFENSCRRDGKNLLVLELMNDRFKKHLIEKRNFIDIGNDNVELKYQ